MSGISSGQIMAMAATVILAVAAFAVIAVDSHNSDSPSEDEKGTITLVVLRHGESEWNSLNLFTVWTDVDLSENVRSEA